jgi:1,4-alpha-glucan branching enzyme
MTNALTRNPSTWTIDTACGPTWLTPNKVSLRVWAPHGERVTVQLEDGRHVASIREHEGAHFWTAELEDVKPGDRYRILLRSSWNDCHHSEGDELLRRDPYARETDFESTWCVLVDPDREFAFSNEFTAPAFNELLIYELHVGSFVKADQKSAFALVKERLEHVKALGFNAIQLMPTTEFGGIWGYNPRQLLAVHGPWGSAIELAQLIDRAHALGLAVIVDLVLNHGSVKRNCLWNWDGYGPHNNGGIYFEGERDTPWGRRFAFHKKEVRDYLLAACRMWIEEYNVDGLRFDSVHNMPWQLLREMTAEIKAHHPGVFLVAEVTPENPNVVTDAGFDSCWVHAAHFDAVKIMRRRDGAEDGHGRLGLLKAIIDMHPGFPRSCSGVNSILGSHDQCGDRKGGHADGGIHRYFIDRLGGRDNWHGRAQVRLWAALQAFCRGVPMLFMGSETLQSQWWHVDQAHGFDWRLVDGGDVFAEQTMRCLKDANTLRSSRASLTSENVRFVHEDPQNVLLAWVRWADDRDPRKPKDSDDVVLCIANLSERQWEHGDYSVQTGWGAHRRWRCVFNTQTEAYGGWQSSGPSAELQSDEHGRLHLTVPKWSVLALELLR